MNLHTLMRQKLRVSTITFIQANGGHDREGVHLRLQSARLKGA